LGGGERFRWTESKVAGGRKKKKNHTIWGGKIGIKKVI